MDSSLCAPVSSGLVQPLGPFRCFTRVHVHSVLALLAAHSAAPVELALALGDARDARGVVPPPAAHHLAAVRPARQLVAHAAGRAQGAWRRKRERVRPFLLLLHLAQTLPPPPARSSWRWEGRAPTIGSGALGCDRLSGGISSLSQHVPQWGELAEPVLAVVRAWLAAWAASLAGDAALVSPCLAPCPHPPLPGAREQRGTGTGSARGGPGAACAPRAGLCSWQS